MKIYSDDTNLPYRTTVKKPIDSKRDVDAILARYGITKVMWTWDLPSNNVELVFELTEEFRDMKINPLIRMHPPTIWKKKRRGKPEEIDWQLSMRIFHWYIKNQLAMTYAVQSEKTVAFLPYIVVNKEQTLKDVVIPHLEDVKRLKALPSANAKAENGKVIETDLIEEG